MSTAKYSRPINMPRHYGFVLILRSWPQIQPVHQDIRPISNFLGSIVNLTASSPLALLTSKFKSRPNRFPYPLLPIPYSDVTPASTSMELQWSLITHQDEASCTSPHHSSQPTISMAPQGTIITCSLETHPNSLCSLLQTIYILIILFPSC